MEKREYVTPELKFIRLDLPADVLGGSIMPTNTPETGIYTGDEGFDGGF